MKRSLLGAFGALALLFVGWSAPASSQAPASTSTEKNAVVRFIENALSAPGRQVSLGAMEGALSTSPRLASLTLSDTQGVWLRLEDIALDWRPAALFSGEVEIEHLRIGRAFLPRLPREEDGAAAPQQEGVPELPVDLLLHRLTVAELLLGEALPGLTRQARLTAEGSARLAEDGLALTAMLSHRQRERGSAALELRHQKDTEKFSLDLALEEAADGLLAAALGVTFPEPIRLDLEGEGNLDDFSGTLEAALGGEEVVRGTFATRLREGRRGFSGRLSGTAAPFLPAPYTVYGQGLGELAFEAWLRPEGGLRLTEASLTTSLLALRAQGIFGQDYSPRALELSGRLNAPQGAPLPPLGLGGEAALRAARFALTLEENGAWALEAGLEDFTISALVIGEGTVKAHGMVFDLSTAARRTIDFSLETELAQVKISGLEGMALQDFSPLSLQAAGRLTPESIAVDGIAHLQARRFAFSGTVDREGETLALRLEGGLPLALFNPLLAAQGLRIAGEAALDLTVSGALPAPALSGTLDVKGGTLAYPAVLLRLSGLSAHTAFTTPKGGDIIRLQGEAEGGGIDLAFSGAIDPKGQGNKLHIRGNVPLSLFNPLLAARGGALGGEAALDLMLAGDLAAPRMSGTAQVRALTLTDPQAALSLRDSTARLIFSGSRVTLSDMKGVLNGRGRFTGEGVIDLTGGAGYPLTLDLRLEGTPFTIGTLLTATINGTLRLTGAITGGLVLEGALTVEEATVAVAESLPAQALLLDVAHRRPPPNVRRTLEKAYRALRPDEGAGFGALKPSLSIKAPNRIFVRGRGLDAEFGGSLTLSGTTEAVRPIGAFDLIRGRFMLLGKRITLERGTLTLVGDFDPLIDLAASARADSLVMTVRVTGKASSPEIVLSSSPPLPQDEILARFLFGRSLASLSPLQIARLAVALSGFGGTGDPLSRLGRSAGLDELELLTDEEGGAAVRAGRYLNDNLYVGITTGTKSGAEISVNLDLAEDVKARASLSPTGGSKIGIYYEREY